MMYMGWANGHKKRQQGLVWLFRDLSILPVFAADMS